MNYAFCILLAVLLGGCAAYRPLQIEPVGTKSAVIVPKFTSTFYYFDRDQDIYFVMRGTTTDAATKKPVEQIATVRVFWRPVGGRTSMNITSLNATYRYVLMTPDTVAMYEGAGFVRLWGKNGGKDLKARLMDGDLRLTQASAGFVDTLHRARIRGNFTAKYDDVRALDVLIDAHRDFFARSLLSKPAEAATLPGEPREAGFPLPLESSPEPAAEPGTQPAPEPGATPIAPVSPSIIAPAAGAASQP
jgi:hypothetical protein